MLTSSDLKTGRNTNQSIVRGSTSGTSERQNRRRRLQLSCGECRSKKLSCDRNLPCKRCVRSGRPEQCSFETATGQPPVLNNQVAQVQAQLKSDEIRDLRAEVAKLRELLSKLPPKHEIDYLSGTLHPAGQVEIGQAMLLNEEAQDYQTPANIITTELSDPREKFSSGYYRQHTLLTFFVEIPQLFPFIKEVSDEWLKPRGIYLNKNKSAKNDEKSNAFSRKESALDGLLPSKENTDALVLFYLNHFEQLHRIVHVPTFQREYANFWIPGRTRYPALTALILSMISISFTVFGSSDSSTSPPSKYQVMPRQWVSACDEWLRQQSSKHRKLVHYQVSCLLCLAKRMNIIRKKRYWKDTGSLMQDAVSDGLHCEPPPTDSPYMREMKKRIWFTIQELDLQNSLEYGLPTLLYNIESNFAAPANLDDKDFDEASKVLPISKTSSQYTCTSYQYHSFRSWKLRLEISRRLFSTGVSKTLSYEDVLQYTHEVTQEISSLPPWDTVEAKSGNKSKQELLVYAFLKFQLTECILAIHRPYLQRNNSKFWLSENVCYQMSQDILLLNRKLAGLGIQSLTMLREDLSLASLTIVRITMLQPKDSSSIIMTNSESTIALLEQCLPIMEDRHLRCFYGEPWCFLTMYAAIMLLKIYLGKETWQTTKAMCAQRFLDLHYKYIGRQQIAVVSQQLSIAQDSVGIAVCQQIPTAGSSIFASSEWLDGSFPDIGIDPFDLDLELDSEWESWGSAWPTFPNHSTTG